MPTEIERKFLVSGSGWRKYADAGKTIRQAYLALTGSISVRVRIIGGAKAYVTIKSAQTGATRSEFEYPIPLRDARKLMKLRTGHVIEKRRYAVKAGGKVVFEIDVFKGPHRGLVIAEIELATLRSRFDRPEWLGKEVTGDKRYYNPYLAARSIRRSTAAGFKHRLRLASG